MSEHESIRAVQTWYPQIYLACHTRHMRTRSSRERLSPSDSTILAHLDEEAPLTAATLRRHLGIGAPAMSAALKRLISLGYVTQSADGTDARRRQLRLTPAGARAMAGSSVLESHRVRAMIRRLSKAEQRRALEGLALLARAARDVMIGRR